MGKSHAPLSLSGPYPRRSRPPCRDWLYLAAALTLIAAVAVWGTG